MHFNLHLSHIKIHISLQTNQMSLHEYQYIFSTFRCAKEPTTRVLVKINVATITVERIATALQVSETQTVGLRNTNI